MTELNDTAEETEFDFEDNLAKLQKRLERWEKTSHGETKSWVIPVLKQLLELITGAYEDTMDAVEELEEEQTERVDMLESLARHAANTNQTVVILAEAHKLAVAVLQGKVESDEMQARAQAIAEATAIYAAPPSMAADLDESEPSDSSSSDAASSDSAATK